MAAVMSNPREQNQAAVTAELTDMQRQRRNMKHEQSKLSVAEQAQAEQSAAAVAPANEMVARMRDELKRSREARRSKERELIELRVALVRKTIERDNEAVRAEHEEQLMQKAQVLAQKQIAVEQEIAHLERIRLERVREDAAQKEADSEEHKSKRAVKTILKFGSVRGQAGGPIMHSE